MITPGSQTSEGLQGEIFPSPLATPSSSEHAGTASEEWVGTERENVAAKAKAAVSAEARYILPVDTSEGEIDGTLLLPALRKMRAVVDRYQPVREKIDAKYLGWAAVVAEMEQLRAELLAARVRVPEALKRARWDEKVTVGERPAKIAVQAFLDLCDAYTTNAVRKPPR